MHILGDRGRGYEDDDEEGYAGNFPEGGGRWSSFSGGESAQQSNIKSTSTVINVVATTARAMKKAADRGRGYENDYDEGHEVWCKPGLPKNSST